MTGYGRASANLGAHALTAQVSSVNRRSLDLTIGLPREWESLEPEIAEAVRRGAIRGKVHVEVEVVAGGPGEEIAWDEAAVRSALARLAQLAEGQGVAFRPTP